MGVRRPSPESAGMRALRGAVVASLLVSVLVASGAGAAGQAIAAATTTTATTTTRARGAAPSPLRLETARSFAGGSIRFEPAPSSVRVVRAKASMVRVARKELLPGTVAPTPEVFFAAYALETTQRISTGPTTSTRDVRSVWVVRFPRVAGERKTAVILRANLPTVAPVTTIARRVSTDVLVVIDDVTGEVVLRSEFAPEESLLNEKVLR